ncbi:MAG: GGDEF domain-containing protein [Phreatobacter sp.]|uniref:GGDEF domain-containing protein n=1 Tax=Phreatobacter sp. TaxID=1966341 RepID=UPI004035DAB1
MPFKIQHLQWLGGILAAAACLALGGMSLRTNLADHERYRHGGAQLARYNAVLVAANAVSAERGPSNSAMGGAAQDHAALAAALATKRADTDRMIAAAEALFAGESAATAEVQRLQADLHLKLGQGRAAVDAVVSRPADRRLGTDVAFAIEMMFAAADTAIELRDQLGRAVVADTPQIAAHVVLNNVAGKMREDAGRLGSYVVMMLTAEGPRRQNFQAKIAETQARLQDMRRFLASFAGALFKGGEVDGVFDTVNRIYFGESLPYARAVASLAAGAGPNADTFTRAYVPGMRPVEDLRVMIAERSQSTIDGLRDQASRLVLASLMLTLVVVLALAVISIVFRDGLFLPLLTARQQIIAIAHGDLTGPPVMSKVSAEVRGMFEGLDVLREQQRQRLLLEEEQRRLADQLRHLSRTDMLTGLLNRRALNELALESFGSADAEGRTHGVVLFDIDHFKAINDSQGHAAGDTVLAAIAREVGPELAPGATFARYGGEEFIVLLPDTSEAAAMALAERLRRAISRVAVPNAPQFVVTGSFGVAVRPPDAVQSWEHLVATADQRLYRAKRAGRNRTCGPEPVTVAPPLAAESAAPIALRTACGG